ncbi:MAG: DNA modification methylase [Promethearchaeota archaeon CR_4]|nr:MAG: DNA modification methylase [Candidatus Lokiarchaeota archaeon CR_4]
MVENKVEFLSNYRKGTLSQNKNLLYMEDLFLSDSLNDLIPLYEPQLEPECVILSPKGKYTPRNALNNLTGTEWIQFTKSWFIHAPPPRNKEEVLHPAKFPEDLIAKYVEFFTKKGAWVLDPFAGTGSTQVACEWMGRNAIGIEITPHWAEIASRRSRNYTIIGDSTRLREMTLPPFDFCISSPPYWDMLRHSRGGSDSTHKDRIAKGLPTHFSEHENDLGNVEEYEAFLALLLKVYTQVAEKMKPGAYCAVVMQNIQKENQQFFPLAWDFALKMRGCGWKLCQEMVWCQRDKKLGIWGYPNSYISNVHHHYFLIFRAPNRVNDLKEKDE